MYGSGGDSDAEGGDRERRCEEKRKRLMEEFFESQFRKRRRVGYIHH